MNNKETLTMKLQQLNNLKEEVKSIQKEFFHSTVTDTFEEFPRVKYIGWSQYTPYFNDGDPCVFGVNDPKFIIDVSEGNTVELGGDEIYEVLREEVTNGHDIILVDPWNLKNYNGERDQSEDFWIKYYKDNYECLLRVFGEKSFDTLTETIGEFFKTVETSEDTLEELFGDGVLVILSKDGITTEEYDHD